MALTKVKNSNLDDADLVALAGLAVGDGNFIVGDGNSFVIENGATARTSLGLGSIATSNAEVLTNVPAGAVFTDTVYSKPSSEPISYVSGLQTSLDAKVDDTQVGTGANKLVQLNASGELPAVSAVNLTDLPSTGGSVYFTDIGSYFTTI
jgi:hypothetical protein